MISDKHKFIFSHLPRSAGSAFEGNYITRFEPDLATEEGDIETYVKKGIGYFPRPPSWKSMLQDAKHMVCCDYKKYFPNKWDKYLTFSIVRNPWDWFASLYYMRRGDFYYRKRCSPSFDPDNPGKGNGEDVEFGDWARHWGKLEAKEMYTGIGSIDPYFFIDGKMALDYAIPYEAHDECMRWFWSIVLEEQMPYGFEVQQGYRPSLDSIDKYRQLYVRDSQWVKEFVEEVVAPKTINYFGYKFE